MQELKTTIGLEIHVQLKTKSKMFCGCDNDAQGKAPNTVVCPVCLGLPGALPVANKQAIEWTIKTGIALGCEIPKIAKFDRKHYFYPDLPKGYQISQYDEPFAIRGRMEIRNTNSEIRNEEEFVTVRINRVHLEEDAGKLIHAGDKSLVDLNRAGTPLMEIVTEPDVTSPEMAGDFLRKLQKIVRDQVGVSEASMEKGHLRCDANISLCEMQDTITKKQTPKKMSPIIELKNLNSFKFVEKALALVEEKLKSEVDSWPEKLTKETWGYDSVNNKVYLQRRKEEAADYRYFPEPDIPPFDTTVFDLEKMKEEIGQGEEEGVANLIAEGVAEMDAKSLFANKSKLSQFEVIKEEVSDKVLLAKALVHNYFGAELSGAFSTKDIAMALDHLSESKINKGIFAKITKEIIENGRSFEELISNYLSDDKAGDLEMIVEKVLLENHKEVERYKSGQTQLLGFFVGQIMKETKGVANPQIINKILREKLS